MMYNKSIFKGSFSKVLLKFVDVFLIVSLHVAFVDTIL